MSRSIDERVVEMRFDNSNFERNVQTSMSTLDRLKMALNLDGATRGLENIDNAARNVDLSGIAAGVDAIQNKFSALGIVGMRVLTNLTDAAMRFASKGLSFVYDTIVEGGKQRALSIENARFTLQGLFNDEEKVNEIMKQAMDSVDGTAYGFDEAAKAAGQFASSGIDGGERLDAALRAVAGTAATTNQEYERISQIFTNVAGNGRLMGDQLLQLSSAGVNAASILKKYFNDVHSEQKEATAGTKEAINALYSQMDAAEGSAEAQKASLEKQYENQKKAFDKSYDAKKKAYDKEYDALKESLDQEYDLKKKEYDKTYDALSDYLDEQIEAAEKANEKALDEAEKAYEADVRAYEKATEERIALIDKEYNEKLKLINEEEYERIKAIDNQIDALNEEAEAEARAEEEAEQAKKRAELQKAIDSATTTEDRQKAIEALNEYEEKLAKKEREKARKERINELKEEKAAIKDETQEKKEAAKEARDEEVQIVKDESKETLAAKKSAHAEEMAAMKEQQKEQIKAMKDSKKDQLSALKESQTIELETLKKSQQNQLESLKESQSEQLSAFKEAQQDRLSTLKDTIKAEKKILSSGAAAMELTEADIRDLASKGLISFDMFAEAMDNAFGKHAKDANKTFTGAMANIKAALKKIGELFYTPLIQQEGPVVDLLNAVRVKINEIKKVIVPVANTFGYIVNKMASAFALFLSNIREDEVVSYLEGIKIAAEEVEKAFWSFDFRPWIESIANVFDGLKNILAGIWSIIKPIGQALLDVFAPNLVNNVLNLTESFKNLTANFKLGDTASRNLRSTFKGLFSIIDIICQAIGALLRLFFPTLEGIDDLGGGILGITGYIGEWIAAIDEWIKKNDIFNKAVNKIHKVVRPVFEAIANTINGTIQSIKTFARTKFVTPDVYAIERFFARLQEALAPLKKIGEQVKERITEILRNIRDAFIALISNGDVDTFLSKFQNSFSSFGEFVSTIKDWLIDSFNAIADAIKKFISNMDKVLDKSADVFKQLSSKGASLLDERDFADLMGAGALGFIVAIFNKFVGVFKTAQKDITSSITKTLGSVRDVLKTYQNDLRADILKSIAVSIAILAGSLWVLSTIPAEKLQPAGIALGAIAFGFGVITAAIAKINSSGNLLHMANASVYLLAMATSMLILAAAVKKFEGMDVDAIGMATASLWVLAKTLTEMTEVFSRLDEDSISNLIEIGKGMLIISASMAVLTFSIYKLARLKPEKMFQGLVGVIVGISAMAVSMRIIGDNAEDMPVVGAGMLLIAAAMTLLMVPISILGSMRLDALAKGLGAVLFSLLSMIMVSTFASESAPYLIAFGAGLTVVAAGLTLLVAPITALGLLPLPAVVQGITAILVALAGFSVIGLIANYSAPGLAALSASLILMATGMTLLITPITILGALPLDVVAQGLGVILGALLGYSVIGLIATAASVGLMALGASLIMISGAIVIAGVGMAALGVGVALLGTALINLSKMSPEAAQNVVDALTTIVKGAIQLVPTMAKAFGEGIIMVAQTIADGAPTIADAVNTILAEIIAVVLSSRVTIDEALLVMIEGILEALSKHGGKIADYLVTFLSDIFTILAERIDEIVRPFMQFLDKLFKVIAEELEKMDFSNLQKILEEISSLSDIMKSIAELSVMGPLITLGIINLLAAVGLLTMVLTALGAIYQIPGLVWFVEQGGEFLAAIGEAIGGFVGSLTGGILEGVISQLPKMGQDLSDFMDNLGPFLAGASSISAETMSGVRSLAETVLILTAADLLDRFTGWTSWFTGGTSLANFGRQLKDFGEPLVEFANTVQGVDSKAVEGAASAAKMMVEVADMIPTSKEKSVLGFFTGSNNIDTFGRMLLYFGYYIADFAKTVENVKPEAVEGAASAAKMMTEVADMVPTSKSWVAHFFTGSKDIDEFGKMLLYFGYYLVAFAEKVKDVTPEGIEGAANATKMLAEVAEMVPKSEGIFESILHGNNNIDQFGAMLESFGRSLKSFYETIQGIAVTQLTVVINDVRSLIDLINGMKGLDASGTGQFVTGLKNLADAGIDNFVKAFNGSYSKAQTTVSNFINTVSSAFTNYSASLVKTATSIGTNVTTALSTGIQNGITPVSNSAKRAGTEIVNAMQNALPDWKAREIGRDFCIGVADGIDDNTRIIYNAAWDAANEAYEAAQDALDINSPSKVGAAIGKFWDLGIAGGMNEYSAKIGEASDGIAEEMMKIQTLSLDDYEPKIRPVLDLSNAKMATDTVNENLALDINPQLENLSGITNLLGAEINSGFSGLKDVFGSQSASIVEVIDRLRSDVNSLTEKVDGLQIVMDTGTLVGELAPGMNMRLGQMATYSGRRM